MNGGEENDGAQEMLQQGAGLLFEIAPVCDGSSALAERLTGMVYELEDISSELSSMNEDV